MCPEGWAGEGAAAAEQQRTGLGALQSLPESRARRLPRFPAHRSRPTRHDSRCGLRVLAGVNPVAWRQTPILDLGTPCFLSFK